MAPDTQSGVNTIGVTIVMSNGAVQNIRGVVGETLMEAAVDHQIAGIAATCGGCCACATCHVIVSPDWYDRVGPPGPMENDTLYFGAARRPTSRLSCQIDLTTALNGLQVTVAT
ncbi:2Fe-2S iron-sulfur cluster-binding protein [Sphingomonas paeninsulae]